MDKFCILILNMMLNPLLFYIEFLAYMLFNAITSEITVNKLQNN